jgi:dolichol-phosphate mannosyltransferase
MNSTGKKLISIVVPVYNEEDNIDVFYKRILGVMDFLANHYTFELVFTDNHSTDKTFEKLKSLSVLDKRIKVKRFSKNFGYQRSILTGYLSSQGAAAIQLDVDLQDPPELIPKFLARWEEGYKVVYGVRKSREESRILHASRKIFYRCISFLSDTKLPHDAGDFRLIDRCIINELSKLDDMQPYLRGAICEIGFKQVGIEYERSERKHGLSKFSLRHLFSLAFDGITNHSIIPLRFATYTGLLISLITFVGIFCFVIRKFLFGKHWPAGFATTSILILMSLSLNALFLGIIGEYLGRVYRQVKKSSLTIVEEELNNDVK